MFSCLRSSFFKTEEVFGPGRENVLPSPERPYFLRAEELTSFARRSRIRFLKTEYLAQMSILEMDDIYGRRGSGCVPFRAKARLRPASLQCKLGSKEQRTKSIAESTAEFLKNRHLGKISFRLYFIAQSA